LGAKRDRGEVAEKKSQGSDTELGVGYLYKRRRPPRRLRLELTDGKKGGGRSGVVTDLFWGGPKKKIISGTKASVI